MGGRPGHPAAEAGPPAGPTAPANQAKPAWWDTSEKRVIPVMTLNVAIARELGTHLADGARAAEFRQRRTEPYVDLAREIVLDFTGVRIANSSFINALVARVVEQHGKRVVDRLVLKGCNPAIRVLVETAIDPGLRKIEGRIDA